MRKPSKYEVPVQSKQSTLYGSKIAKRKAGDEPAPAGKVFVEFTAKPGEIVTDAGGRKYIVWHDRSLRRVKNVADKALGPVGDARRRYLERLEENRNTVYGENGEPRPETDDEVVSRLFEEDRAKVEALVAADTAAVTESVKDEPAVTEQEASGKQEAAA